MGAASECWFLQVNQEDVAFRDKYKEQQKLEGLVADGLYPPAIHCAVTYSRPPDFGNVSLETLEVDMTGTDRQQVTFPVEVYQAKGEYMYVFHFKSCRLNLCLTCCTASLVSAG